MHLAKYAANIVYYKIDI